MAKKVDVKKRTEGLCITKTKYFEVFVMMKHDFPHYLTIFSDILKNNDLVSFGKYYEYFQIYCSTNKMYEKLLVRYGKERAEEYRDKLSVRSKNKKPSGLLTKDYWISRGFSEEEAKEKVKKEARGVGAKAKRKKWIKGERAKQQKHSKQYWLSRGYTEEETEELRKPYLLKISSSLEGYKHRNECEVAAEKLYNERHKKRLKTLLDRYGTTVITARTSKESLKFFVPLYKELRKNGFKKEDFMWGISGSKEFTTRYDNKNYMYDFCILSKKIIIEYNHVFWHPHEDHRFENPFLTETEALEKDLLKRFIVEKMGFTVYYVWNFEDKETKIKQLKELIINEE